MPPFKTALKRKRETLINPDKVRNLLEKVDKSSLVDVCALLDDLQNLVNSTTHEGQFNSVESVPASSIKEMDRLLSLVPNLSDTYPKTIWEVKENGKREAHFPELMQSYKLIIESTDWWGWKRCEAMSRTPIDLVLLDRIGAHNASSSGTKLYMEVEHNITTICSSDASTQRTISGVADYVLGYKYRNSTFALCNSFVAIDAKRHGSFDSAIPQCTAYMVGIQQQRQEANKSLHVVYGAVTNGIDWTFLRLDSEQSFSRSIPLSMLTSSSQIFTFLDSILFAASCSSPTTSPIKNADGNPRIFVNHSQFSAIVEAPHFVGMTGSLEDWKDILVEVDDEVDEEN